LTKGAAFVSGGADWGKISGDIKNQTDLQSEWEKYILINNEFSNIGQAQSWQLQTTSQDTKIVLQNNRANLYSTESIGLEMGASSARLKTANTSMTFNTSTIQTTAGTTGNQVAVLQGSNNFLISLPTFSSQAGIIFLQEGQTSNALNIQGDSDYVSLITKKGIKLKNDDGYIQLESNGVTEIIGPNIITATSTDIRDETKPYVKTAITPGVTSGQDWSMKALRPTGQSVTHGSGIYGGTSSGVQLFSGDYSLEDDEPTYDTSSSRISMQPSYTVIENNVKNEVTNKESRAIIDIQPDTTGLTIGYTNDTSIPSAIISLTKEGVSPNILPRIKMNTGKTSVLMGDGNEDGYLPYISFNTTSSGTTGGSHLLLGSQTSTGRDRVIVQTDEGSFQLGDMVQITSKKSTIPIQLLTQGTVDTTASLRLESGADPTALLAKGTAEIRMSGGGETGTSNSINLTPESAHSGDLLLIKEKLLEYDQNANTRFSISDTSSSLSSPVNSGSKLVLESDVTLGSKSHNLTIHENSGDLLYDNQKVLTPSTVGHTELSDFNASQIHTEPNINLSSNSRIQVATNNAIVNISIELEFTASPTPGMGYTFSFNYDISKLIYDPCGSIVFLNGRYTAPCFLQPDGTNTKILMITPYPMDGDTLGTQVYGNITFLMDTYS
jgi:hypothetical protein